MKKLFIVLLLLANTAYAAEAKPLADDPVIEARLKAMSSELRCLVCQNTTLADSTAPLAEDLRKEIRVLMREGKSDQEVIDYLVARYGDFVLYRPPVKSITWLLWFGPFVLLLGAAASLIFFLKRRRRTLDETPLSAAETARIQSLLNQESDRE